MKDRLMNHKETLLFIVKFLYFTLAFPTILFVGGVPLLLNNKELAYEGLLLIFIGCGIPLMFSFYIKTKRRKKLKEISSYLKSHDYFSPQDQYHEVCHSNGTYFGIDAKNCTILYIRLIRKGIVDILGLTLHDLVRRSIEGRSTLRLYTRFTDLPCIQIKTAYAQHFFDMIGAMECKNSATNKDFNEYVNNKIGDIERSYKVKRLPVN